MRGSWKTGLAMSAVTLLAVALACSSGGEDVGRLDEDLEVTSSGGPMLEQVSAFAPAPKGVESSDGEAVGMGADLEGIASAGDVLASMPESASLESVSLVESPEALAASVGAEEFVAAGEDRAFNEGVVDVASCRARFREIVLSYVPGLLVHEVRLASEKLKAERPDCGEGGWSPRFVGRSECDPSNGRFTVGSGRHLARLSHRFIDGSDADRDTRLGGTRSSPSGDVLIHFAKLPEENQAGCWFYDAHHEVWYVEKFAMQEATAVVSGLGGRSCEDAFRALLKSASDGGYQLSSAEVVSTPTKF